MKYSVQLKGKSAEEQSELYALEVFADHKQEAKTIALVKAQSAGIDVKVSSIEVTTSR
ncbi:hypothetical protein [Almyronema epifaneia]|uniref:Uncharacterized protein n=1 Tax=Almyronema epifaneia S1 TaxID=2991925 RepID=A0ABW6IJS2_9CYAN